MREEIEGKGIRRDTFSNGVISTACLFVMLIISPVEIGEQWDGSAGHRKVMARRQNEE